MDLAALPLVIRLPSIDHASDESDFVLVHVSSTGRHPLDLKLIGTENSAVFSVSLKHSSTSSSKARKFVGTQEQWEETLAVTLLGAKETGFTEGVEAVAKVEKDGSSIAINIQKRIEGITQKLGTINLPAKEDEEVDIFEWCGLTVKSKLELRKELGNLKNELSKKDEQIKKLNESLAELVKLKRTHEDELIQKFSILLNEKKLKIRDQQRLLASANVDPRKLESVERNRIDARSSPPGPSRAGKRKVAAVAKSDRDDDSDNEFEKMDVDAGEPQPPSEEDDRQTEDEQSTADETEDDDAPPLPHHTKKSITESSGTGKTIAQSEEDASLPSKRELPLPKKPADPAPKLDVAPLDGSETESDDEL